MDPTVTQLGSTTQNILLKPYQTEARVVKAVQHPGVQVASAYPPGAGRGMHNINENCQQNTKPQFHLRF